MIDAGAGPALKQSGVYNYFGIFKIDDDKILPAVLAGEAFTPAQAKYIDDKIDDGYPGSGIVAANYSNDDVFSGYDWDLDFVFADGAYYLVAPPGTPVQTGKWCAFVPAGTARWVYNVLDFTASCAPRIRAGF
jgi:hypothetical protein